MDRYLADGNTVIGTYRREARLEQYRNFSKVHLLPLDLNFPDSFSSVVEYLIREDLRWDVFIASNGTMEPIGPFMQLDDKIWQDSIISNAIAPCRLLKALYPLRKLGKINDAVFFAGGGTNNAFANYSAYCLSKIFLIKMCELLDDEVKDLKTFILGPGYVRTKIHQETLNAAEQAGGNLEKTLKFLENEGTSLDEIYKCIQWCLLQDREVVGGRNLSVVHDPWRNGSAALVEELRIDPDKYKLRRAGNT